MDELTSWIATALARFNEPDVTTQPATVDTTLPARFAGDFTARLWVDELAQAVHQSSNGAVTLFRVPNPPNLLVVRGPAAYLGLAGQRLFRLAPDPNNPVVYQ